MHQGILNMWAPSELYFDLGNSALKWWRVVERQQITDQGQLAWSAWSDEQIATIMVQPTEQFIVATVVRDERYRRFRQMLQALAPQTPWRELTTAPTSIAIECRYDSRAQLGVDRWLAVVASVVHYRLPALIVDYGTAVNLEFVVAPSTYLGGYILPGRGLTTQLLARGTDGVQVDLARACEPPLSLQPGCSTAAALLNGHLAATLGAVKEGIQWLKTTQGVEPQLILTGGGRGVLAVLLDDPAVIVDSALILKGMLALMRTEG